MTDTPMVDAWLVAQRLHDEFDGYSAGEIERMSLSEYARLRERAGLPPVDHPATPTPAPAPPPAPGPEQAVADPEPQGVDFQNMSMSDYAALRAQLGIGRSAANHGIFG